MALGHEKLDVYRLGKRGYAVHENAAEYEIDPDSDFDSDENYSLQRGAGNVASYRTTVW